jgi:hypothetical protein
MPTELLGWRRRTLSRRSSLGLSRSIPTVSCKLGSFPARRASIDVSSAPRARPEASSFGLRALTLGAAMLVPPVERLAAWGVALI